MLVRAGQTVPCKIRRLFQSEGTSMSKADIAAERKDQIARATVDCIAKIWYHNFFQCKMWRAMRALVKALFTTIF